MAILTVSFVSGRWNMSKMLYKISRLRGRLTPQSVVCLTHETFLKWPMILLRSLLTSPIGSSIMHTIAIPSVDSGRSKGAAHMAFWGTSVNPTARPSEARVCCCRVQGAS